MRRIIVALVAALLMTSLVACGKAKTDAAGAEYSATNCPTENQENFQTVRIAADLGIVYVAFDKFIYKPYKENHLSGVVNKGKAAIAAVAIYHFAKKVKDHIIYSKTLCPKIGKPIAALYDKLGGLTDMVKNLATGGAGIESLKTMFNGLPGLAHDAGLPNLDLKNGVGSIEDLAGLK